MGGCLSYRLKLVSDQVPIEDTLFPNVTHFSFESLKNATNNFSTSNVIRKSGFSKSYKGNLEDGSVVTIMVYSRHIYGKLDFTSTIKIMSGVKHHNVVELIGYCIEDDRKMLVLEFVGDYTLDQLLFSDHSIVGDVVLDWPRRVSICHGIARALDYLHNGINPRVVHRDVKPSNFLIDHNFNPKITDFEVSCLLEDAESHHSSTVVGTWGYLDPEYVSTGRYSEKTDVYAFGITLLEIISGKRSFLQDEDEYISLLDWTWELQESGRISDIVDPSLSEY